MMVMHDIDDDDGDNSGDDDTMREGKNLEKNQRKTIGKLGPKSAKQPRLGQT